MYNELFYGVYEFFWAVDPFWVHPAAAAFTIVALLVGLKKHRQRPVVLSVVSIALILVGLVLRITEVYFTALSSAGIFWVPVAFFLLAILFGPVVLSVIAFIMALATRSQRPAALARAAADPTRPTPNAQPTNALAIASVISVWFAPLLGVVLGHIALSQIRVSQALGRRMALTGTIAGWSLIALVVALIAVAAFAVGTVGR